MSLEESLTLQGPIPTQCARCQKANIKINYSFHAQAWLCFGCMQREEKRITTGEPSPRR